MKIQKLQSAGEPSHRIGESRITHANKASTKLRIRLVYWLLVGNVILRFFTNYFDLVPRFFNLIDVGITAILWFAALVSIRDARSRSFSLTTRLLAFNGVLVVGAMLNANAFYLPAALAQAIMLSEPILLFGLISDLPFEVHHIERFDRILRRLIILQFSLGVIQFPSYLAAGNSEVIVGTFYGNAEQYTGFLLLGVCYYLGRFVTHATRRSAHISFVLALLVLIPFVDNKASWLGVIATLYCVVTRLGIQNGSRAKQRLAFAALSIIVLLVATTTSRSISKFSGLNEALTTGNFWNLGKIKAYEDIFESIRQSPHMALFGAGPGTFYSRAGQQFYVVTDNIFLNPKESEYLRTLSTRTSNSMGGVITPTSTVEPFYKRFYINKKIFSIGSAQVDSPFSSYAGLLGETGLIGSFLYMSFYVSIFRRLRRYWSEFRNDKRIFPLITASVGFLIYSATVSIYNPWLETGRMTTILWAMMAVVCRYAARFQDGCDQTGNSSSFVNHAVERYPSGSAFREPFKSVVRTSKHV